MNKKDNVIFRICFISILCLSIILIITNNALAAPVSHKIDSNCKFDSSGVISERDSSNYKICVAYITGGTTIYFDVSDSTQTYYVGETDVYTGVGTTLSNVQSFKGQETFSYSVSNDCNTICIFNGRYVSNIYTSENITVTPTPIITEEPTVTIEPSATISIIPSNVPGQEEDDSKLDKIIDLLYIIILINIVDFSTDMIVRIRREFSSWKM